MNSRWVCCGFCLLVVGGLLGAQCPMLMDPMTECMPCTGFCAPVTRTSADGFSGTITEVTVEPNGTIKVSHWGNLDIVSGTVSSDRLARISELLKDWCSYRDAPDDLQCYDCGGSGVEFNGQHLSVGVSEGLSDLEHELYQAALDIGVDDYYFY